VKVLSRAFACRNVDGTISSFDGENSEILSKMPHFWNLAVFALKDDNTAHSLARRRRQQPNRDPLGVRQQPT